MLFDKKNNRIIKAVWAVFGILVIISMILLYFPAIQY